MPVWKEWFSAFIRAWDKVVGGSLRGMSKLALGYDETDAQRVRCKDAVERVNEEAFDTQSWHS